MSKTKVHTRYKNTEGKVVPSVTTIIDNIGWNKHILMAWVKRTTLEGEDPDKVRDKAADIGTIAHAMIEEHITSEAPHLETIYAERDEYSSADLIKAEIAFEAYLIWEKSMDIDLTDERVRSEVRMVSEWYQYGGTADFLAPLGDVFCLIDFKSSNGVYREHVIQLAAYEWMVEENMGLAVPAHLLQVGKDEPDFHHYQFTDLSNAFNAFKAARQLHDLKKLIKT